MIINYKCTFGLKEGKSTSMMQKQMLSQREQYKSTVHLFIGMGRSPCKITPMPFTLANNSIVIQRGLNSLFPFKSVSFSAITPKLPCA
jgi:molybdenum cofactor biosynthesis enzyme MoaA